MSQKPYAIPTCMDLEGINNPEKIHLLGVIDLHLARSLPPGLVAESRSDLRGRPIATLGPLIQFARAEQGLPEAIHDDMVAYFIGNFPTTSNICPLVFEDVPFKLSWHTSTSPAQHKGWSSLKAPKEAVPPNARGFFTQCQSYHARWTQNYILKFLKLASYDVIPFDNSLSIALMSFWHPVYNCFVFSDGFKTITLYDITLMTGLSAVGESMNYIPLDKNVTTS